MTYQAVFHVDQNEAQVLNLALNNVLNLLNAIGAKRHDLVVLFNGPAANLVAREGVGEFLERITELKKKGVRFQVCKNAMLRFEISDEQVIDACEVIPASMVALIELQDAGFAYIKP